VILNPTAISMVRTYRRFYQIMDEQIATSAKLAKVIWMVMMMSTFLI
jgi:hypothetical protein